MASDGSTAILIIDGNHQDREHYAGLLRKSSPDYEIFQAGDGKSGLERCHGRVFDCVVLELDLPDMSGIEVLRELVPLRQRPDIPIVVLTRLANEALLSAAVLYGAQACLQKQQASAEMLDHAVTRSMITVGNVQDSTSADSIREPLDLERNPPSLSLSIRERCETVLERDQTKRQGSAD